MLIFRAARDHDLDWHYRCGVRGGQRIPAIFAITEDPFIVMTSKIFAILGLRAMYFLLADLKDRFHLLTYGLGVILVFVGTKILIVDWVKFRSVSHWVLSEPYLRYQ